MNWEAIQNDVQTQKVLVHWQKLGRLLHRHHVGEKQPEPKTGVAILMRDGLAKLISSTEQPYIKEGGSQLLFKFKAKHTLKWHIRGSMPPPWRKNSKP